MNAQNKSQKDPIAPLESILSDPGVTEIMIDGHERVYIEKEGKFVDVPSPYPDEAALLDFIQALVTMTGRKVDESHPMVDIRLEDGTLVNIVLPPISMVGPVVTLAKKFTASPLTVEKLISFNSWTEDIASFLQQCVSGRLNILISGGTGSGKTTLLNVITQMAPEDERIITLERNGELNIQKKFRHLVRLSSRPANIEGKGAITLRDLVINAVRMRPDRLVTSELRGEEALHMMAAMSTGHDGSLAAIHASSPRDAITRLEGMITMSNPSLPLLNVRETIASALNLIVQIERLPDGTRKVAKVTEVVGMQGDLVALQDIFEFRRIGMEDGKIKGAFTATGHIPKFVSDLRAAGIEVPVSLFTPK